MFADQVKIYIRSGKGGDGHVGFRRELFVPAGGPNGGDGGKGGDVIFVVDEGLNTLSDFRHMKKYCAPNGEDGGKNRCHGADGEDLIIKVPEGTVIRDAESGRVIADMSHGNKRVTVLKGGRGGKGNQHYATATMQAPKYAQPGQRAMELVVTLELKVIADVPDGRGFVIADIPGIIEGASEGVGLGFEFLRHIERTKVMIHIVDAASVEGRDPIDDIYKINAELEAYNPEIAKRPQVIAANKIDTLYEGENDDAITLLREEFEPKGIKVFPISAVSGKGVRELLFYVREMLDQIGDEPVVFEPEYVPVNTDVEEPYTVSVEDGVYVVEGPRIEKMLGYTNLESEKGFDFFQKFLKENGILDELEKAGIQEGDTVRMYGLEFDYYK